MPTFDAVTFNSSIGSLGLDHQYLSRVKRKPYFWVGCKIYPKSKDSFFSIGLILGIELLLLYYFTYFKLCSLINIKMSKNKVPSDLKLYKNYLNVE